MDLTPNRGPRRASSIAKRPDRSPAVSSGTLTQVLAGEVRLHVADDGETAAVSECRAGGPSSTVSDPSLERASAMSRLGVTHQALELLTRHVDVGAVDRVRLPSPAVAVVGQAGRSRPAVKMAARTVRHVVEAGPVRPHGQAPPPPPSNPARPMLTSPSGPVRVSGASVRRVPSTKATRRGRSASVGRCATNAPPSSTSSHSTACGESSGAWKPAP